MNAIELVETPRLARWTLRFSILAVVALVVWAALAEIDQITRANGAVIASSRIQVLQSLEGGIVAEIRVREGDIVAKDQLLLRLDRTKAESSYLESRAKRASLESMILRLRAETFDQPLRYPKAMQDAYPDLIEAQRLLYDKRREALHAEIGALERSVALIKQELALNEPLLQTGDVSAVEVLRLRRQVSDLESQITNKRNRYFQDAQAELAKAEEDFASVDQIVTQRKDQLDRIELTAPVRGIVKNIRTTTVGGVVRPGEEVMHIVPLDDTLLIEAKIRPADMGFIKPGLPATVKLDAYDFTQYGSLEGTLRYLSADTFADENRSSDQTYYRAHIEATNFELASRNSEKIEVIPGMTAVVEIKTGKNTVLRYLLKPITRATAESLTER
jgi:adhesin transport system membrane fusion protein